MEEEGTERTYGEDVRRLCVWWDGWIVRTGNYLYTDGLGPLKGRYRANGYDAWAVLEGDGILLCVNEVDLSRLEGRTIVLCGCMRYKWTVIKMRQRTLTVKRAPTKMPAVSYSLSTWKETSRDLSESYIASRDCSGLSSIEEQHI